MNYDRKIKELTYEERAVWGICPICNAKDGEKCDGNVGLCWGYPRPKDGVHLARLNNSPNKVKITPCD